jgi:NAD(P)-dependent dehydrogenase (short-subunit alcohol dehydrogenase family)
VDVIDVPAAAVDLTGKAAIVTGGASGLGAAVAAGMASAGARVLLVDRNAEGLTEVEGQIRSQAGVCSHLEIDVADVSAPSRIVQFAIDQFASLDVLVLGAGIHEQSSFDAMSRDGFERVFAVNVEAPYFLAQAALPHLAPGGVIIFVGSTAAVAAIPGGFSAYCATKGAIHSLARALAAELGGRGIRVNEIAPGAFDTPINAKAFAAEGDLARAIVEGTPLKRLGQPQDIVAPVLFLASDGARHVHGATIVVDGGFTVF